MFLVSSRRCLRSIHWSQVLSWEWRCSWSSADRRCSNYIWVINNFIAYEGATYIRGFTVSNYFRSHLLDECSQSGWRSDLQRQPHPYICDRYFQFSLWMCPCNRRSISTSKRVDSWCNSGLYGGNKTMLVIGHLQMIIVSNASAYMHIVILSNFSTLFLRIRLIICQHWFR